MDAAGRTTTRARSDRRPPSKRVYVRTVRYTPAMTRMRRAANGAKLRVMDRE